MNYWILILIGVLIVTSILFTILKYTLSIKPQYWYLFPLFSNTSFVTVIADLASYFYLFSNLIPISLYVTLEVQKFIGIMFIDWDLDMYNEENDQPAKANTSDLLEELGQINYVFTDKTGTLTENQMILKKISVGPSMYSFNDEGRCLYDELNNCSVRNLMVEMELFLTFLSLCHNVEVQNINDYSNVLRNESADLHEIPSYIASSPDEKAIVEFTAKLNFIFLNRIKNKLNVSILDNRKTFTVHYILEFDSNRKRMSVIFENDQNEFWLVLKGADSHVIPLAISGFIGQTQDFINDCSKKGLRTLMIAIKKLTPEEFKEASSMIDNANSNIENRVEMLVQAYESIEKDLDVIGMVAIEDRLQDGIKETIVSLREAGISVWILTGDKTETAINIAFNSGHITSDMDMVTITNYLNDEKLKACINECFKRFDEDKSKKIGIVIDGSSFAQLYKNYKSELSRIIVNSHSFVCCRMSPVQKSQVVKFIRNLPSNPITLAIGDGANDCAMIQEAHVGCGIFGKEGRQAAQCSDFAFHRFKYLKKLLFVHGHIAYYRVCNTILYFIYKNVLLIFPLFIHLFYSFYGTNMLYPSFLFTFFNITWTSLPIFLYGLFEKDFDVSILMSNPSYYKLLSDNSSLSSYYFLFWILNGIYQGFIIYLFTLFGANISDSYNQWLDLYVFGYFILTNVVIIVNIQYILLIKSLNIFLLLSPILSIFVYISVALLHSVVLSNNPKSIIGNFETYYCALSVFLSSYLNLLALIMIFFCLFPYVLFRLFYNKLDSFASKCLSNSRFLYSIKSGTFSLFINRAAV